jgi:phosphoenolpyruvate carboxykinase (GTP)
VLERVAGSGGSEDTAIGRVPSAGALDTTGLDISDETLGQLLAVDNDLWRHEVPQIRDHYAAIGDRVPAELHQQLDALEARLSE